MLSIEVDELIAIESRETLVRAQPKEPIRGLRNRADGILRETLLLGPGRGGILRRGFVRIERRHRMEASQQQNECQQPKHSAFYYVPALPSCKGNRGSLHEDGLGD